MRVLSVTTIPRPVVSSSSPRAWSPCKSPNVLTSSCTSSSSTSNSNNSTSNVRVVVRVRPMMENEKHRGCKAKIHIDGSLNDAITSSSTPWQFGDTLPSPHRQLSSIPLSPSIRTHGIKSPRARKSPFQSPEPMSPSHKFPNPVAKLGICSSSPKTKLDISMSPRVVRPDPPSPRVKSALLPPSPNSHSSLPVRSEFLPPSPNVRSGIPSTSLKSALPTPRSRFGWKTSGLLGPVETRDDRLGMRDDGETHCAVEGDNINNSRSNSRNSDSSNNNNNNKSPQVPRLLTVEISNSNTRNFEFDAVFPPSATQEQVYSLSVGDSIRRNLFRGYNTTVLAYGQTGSGKTYSMGPSASNGKHDGIICRAIQDLFHGKRFAYGWNVTISLNCVELINEEFRDLLVDSNRREQQNLQLRSLGGSDGRVSVEGVTRVVVHSIENATELVNRAAARRASTSTLMNEQSSRSHAIYTFDVSMDPKQQDGGEILNAKLTLVDLAGSERIKQTGVVGLQQKESININKDLFVLGKVVSQLAESAERRGSGANVHIPYRDSKLTRFLQDSFGGNCCTLLIACVSPADIHVDESLNTLRYAERSRSISNAIKKNALSTSPQSKRVNEALKAENRRLTEELAHCRNLLSRSDATVNVPSTSTTSRLSGLQQKINLVKIEAATARESSLSFAQLAHQWRERCNLLLEGNYRSEGESAELRFSEAAILSTENSLEIKSSDAAVYLEAPNTVDVSSDKSSSERVLTLEMTEDSQNRDYVLPKKSILEELEDFTARMEAKRADLEQLNSLFSSRQAIIEEQIRKEERYRDELIEEVNGLKLKVHLLATDLNDGTAGSWGTMLSSFSGDESCDSNGELDTQIIESVKRSTSKYSQATKRIEKLEGGLDSKKRETIEGWSELQASTTQQILHLQEENYVLPKNSILEELEDVTARMEAQRADLEQLNSHFSARQASIEEQISKTERYRDELVEEVNGLKLKVHLLATDLKGGTAGSWNTIFSSISGDESCDSNGELEMKVIGSVTQPTKKNSQATKQIEELENELALKRETIEGWSELQASMSQQIRHLQEENIRYRQANIELAKLREENERLRKQNSLFQKGPLHQYELQLKPNDPIRRADDSDKSNETEQMTGDHRPADTKDIEALKEQQSSLKEQIKQLQDENKRLNEKSREELRCKDVTIQKLMDGIVRIQLELAKLQEENERLRKQNSLFQKGPLYQYELQSKPNDPIRRADGSDKSNETEQMTGDHSPADTKAIEALNEQQSSSKEQIKQLQDENKCLSEKSREELRCKDVTIQKLMDGIVRIQLENKSLQESSSEEIRHLRDERNRLVKENKEFLQLNQENERLWEQKAKQLHEEKNVEPHCMDAIQLKLKYEHSRLQLSSGEEIERLREENKRVLEKSEKLTLPKQENERFRKQNALPHNDLMCQYEAKLTTVSSIESIQENERIQEQNKLLYNDVMHQYEAKLSAVSIIESTDIDKGDVVEDALLSQKRIKQREEIESLGELQAFVCEEVEDLQDEIMLLRKLLSNDNSTAAEILQEKTSSIESKRENVLHNDVMHHDKAKLMDMASGNAVDNTLLVQNRSRLMDREEIESLGELQPSVSQEVEDLQDEIMLLRMLLSNDNITAAEILQDKSIHLTTESRRYYESQLNKETKIAEDTHLDETDIRLNDISTELNLRNSTPEGGMVVDEIVISVPNSECEYVDGEGGARANDGETDIPQSTTEKLNNARSISLVSDCDAMSVTSVQTHEEIRSHAEKVMSWADEVIARRGSRGADTSGFCRPQVFGLPVATKVQESPSHMCCFFPMEHDEGSQDISEPQIFEVLHKSSTPKSASSVGGCDATLAGDSDETLFDGGSQNVSERQMLRVAATTNNRASPVGDSVTAELGRGTQIVSECRVVLTLSEENAHSSSSPLVADALPAERDEEYRHISVSQLPRLAVSGLSEAIGQDFVISNLEKVQQDSECNCSSSGMFSKKEYVEFFLPKVGISCTCGRKQEVQLTSGGDPCALENILKDWQVEFLSSVQIYDVMDFLNTYEQRRGLLTKQMKRWRKEKGLQKMKTHSCAIALHVWSSTCKSVLKAVAEQRRNGVVELVRPEFLEVCLISDTITQSSLGITSAQT